ncbi:MAG: hypothetical protein C5B50_15720 [Verrucomicrobia bacterium]|nr:MAG: hypothetical protein C5B50_15720 [Verrucomicrobiota bacterium]
MVILPIIAVASPLKGPHRVVNGQGVNLVPLFQWWTNHHGARPLTAWVHVTGTIVGTNGFNWVVQAHVEDTGRNKSEDEGKRPAVTGDQRIVLRNSPMTDRAEFERLVARDKELKSERGKTAHVESQAKSQAESSGGTYYGRRSRARAVAQAQAQETEREAVGELKELDKQIKDVETKLASYPTKDHYSVDCFALDTGKMQNGLPVFDHGMSWQ